MALPGCKAPDELEPAGPVEPTLVERSSLRERAIALLEEAALAEDPASRANALEALSRTPSRARGLVGRGLIDENEGVRAVAATVVGRARLTELGPSVRPRLDDPSPFVRASAIYASRRLDAGFDPSGLAPLLLEHPEWRVRAHAAFLLGELGEPSALPVLRDAYGAPGPRATPAEARLMRLQMAEAIVKLGDASPLEGLRAALYASRPEELEQTALAVQIIGEVNDRASIGQLIRLSAYREDGRRMPAEIRLACAGALAKLGRTEGGFIADEYAQSELDAIRAQAASVYGQTGRREHLGKLETMLSDGAASVRVAAADGIVRIVSVGG
ncbi:MAG: HEAT repeat domain-containing protein [Planctomycetota bacterium]